MKLTEWTEQLAKKHYWQEHVASWRESNLSQAAYCGLNDPPTKNFDYWKRKLFFYSGPYFCSIELCNILNSHGASLGHSFSVVPKVLSFIP